jgi:succinoglycan biosynthesis transport protein ExoP
MTSAERDPKPVGMPARLIAEEYSAGFVGGGFDEVILALRRWKLMIAGIATLGATASFLLASAILPLFSAEAVIALDSRRSQITDIKAVVSSAPLDPSVMRTEVEAVQSRAVVERVIAAIQLDQRLDLGTHLSPQFGRQTARIAKLCDAHCPRWLSERLAAWRAAQFRAGEKLSPEEAQARAADWLARNVSVTADGRSYAVKIRAEAPEPILAASIANGYAEAYLAELKHQRSKAVATATSWITAQLSELRADLHEAEHALQEFRASHKLIRGTSSTTAAQQLTELVSQFSIVSAERSQKEAMQQQIIAMSKTSNGIEAIAHLTNSPILLQLLKQESELLQKQAQLGEIYGDAHPALVTVRGQIREAREKIGTETKLTVLAGSRELDAAREREASLQRSLAEARQAVISLDAAQIEERERESDVETKRRQVVELSTRYREIQGQASLSEADAHLLAPAKAPLRPSFPNKALLTLLGAILSIGLGGFMANWLERRKFVYRVLGALEAGTGLFGLGIFPEVRPSKSAVNLPIKDPGCLYNEAIRSIATALGLYGGPNSPKVILVTSSLPGEGKTIFAASLARLQAMDGKRCLLIDGDLRNPTIATALARRQCLKLLDLLSADRSRLLSFAEDSQTGLHIVGGEPGAANPQRLLASSRMREFIEDARRAYDVVVIDAPPVLAVSDAVILSRYADSVVFLAHWDSTPRSFVSRAVQQLTQAGIRAPSVVLSRVNLKKQATYGRSRDPYAQLAASSYYTRRKPSRQVASPADVPQIPLGHAAGE